MKDTMSNREQFDAWGMSDMDLRITLECQTYADIAWMAWQASREALKAEQDGAWIACSDRMPEHGGPFSVWNGKHVGLVTFLFGSFQCLNPEQITHWQLAPVPPSQPHPIDTTSQQYETLAKGDSK